MKTLGVVGLLVLLVAVPALVVFGQDNPGEGRPPLPPPQGMRDRPAGEGPGRGPPPPPPIPPEKREQIEPAVRAFTEALATFHRAAVEILGPRDGNRFTMHVIGRFMEAHRPKPPEGERPQGPPPPQGEGEKRPRPPRGEGERGPRPPRGEGNL